jgi:hypothetical protein
LGPVTANNYMWAKTLRASRAIPDCAIRCFASQSCPLCSSAGVLSAQLLRERIG